MSCDVDAPGWVQRQCEASCSGSCEAQANLDCQIDCQAEGFADCKVEVEGGCEAPAGRSAARCSATGQYVDYGNDFEECVAAIRAAIFFFFDADIDRHARGEKAAVKAEL